MSKKTFIGVSLGAVLAFLILTGVSCDLGGITNTVTNSANTNTVTANTNKLTNTVNTNTVKVNANTTVTTNTNTTQTNTVTADKTAYNAGDTMIAIYKTTSTLGDSAWLGIIPATTAHGDEVTADEVDIDYKYLGSSTAGTMEFTAPANVGSFQFRIYSDDSDANATELASSATFIINAANTVSADKTSYQIGETMIATYSITSTLGDTAWLGVIPANIEHGNEVAADEADISYQYLSGNKSGTMEFTAPSTAGTYQFRVYSDDTDSDATELATSVSFTVIE